MANEEKKREGQQSTGGVTAADFIARTAKVSTEHKQLVNEAVANYQQDNEPRVRTKLEIILALIEKIRGM